MKILRTGNTNPNPQTLLIQYRSVYVWWWYTQEDSRSENSMKVTMALNQGGAT